MNNNTVTQEWQSIFEDETWAELSLPIGTDDRAVALRPEWMREQWILLVILPFVLASTAIYLFNSRTTDASLPQLSREQSITSQGNTPAQTDLVEIKHRQILATEHFRFYASWDSEIEVEAIGPRIEGFYESLRHDFGFSSHPKRIIVEINRERSVDTRQRLDDGRLVIAIPSPTVLTLPENFSADDALFVFLANALTEQIIEELQQPTKVRSAWQQMPEALRRWYVVRHLDGLSLWHDEMIAWLATVDGPARVDAMPLSLRETCRDFGQATQSIAWTAAIPFQLCDMSTSNQDALPIPELPTELEGLNSIIYEWAESTYRAKWWVRLEAATTVIDYVVTEYGSEQVGPLFHGFTQYNSWEELIPALFEVSPAEFEAGWQAHLRL